MATLTFTKSHYGQKTQHTISFEIPNPKDPAEQRLHQFVIDTFVQRKTYELIQFTFKNTSMMELAKNLLFRGNGSSATLYDYAADINRYCKWSGNKPDQMVKACIDSEGVINHKAVSEKRREIGGYITFLTARGLAPYTVCNALKGLKALFRCNYVDLAFAFNLPKRSAFECRSLTLMELQRVMAVANLRQKAVIAVLAVSGVRIGTLVKLRYGHVRYDLERGVVPVHLHIEAEITKGKYHSYDTFLNWEAAEFLKAYLNQRRRGTGYVPTEKITDVTPLFRVMGRPGAPEFLPLKRAADLVRSLYIKSGVVKPVTKTRMYDLRSTSLRMFFRSHMAFLGIERNIIEYMMGHKTDHYLDIKMMGIEYLRNIYRVSGISITQPAEDNRVQILKQMVQRLGFTPEEVFRPEFLSNCQK